MWRESINLPVENERVVLERPKTDHGLIVEIKYKQGDKARCNNYLITTNCWIKIYKILLGAYIKFLSSPKTNFFKFSDIEIAPGTWLYVCFLTLFVLYFFFFISVGICTFYSSSSHCAEQAELGFNSVLHHINSCSHLRNAPPPASGHVSPASSYRPHYASALSDKFLNFSPGLKSIERWTAKILKRCGRRGGSVDLNSEL